MPFEWESGVQGLVPPGNVDPFSLGLLLQGLAQGDPNAIASAEQRGLTPGMFYGPGQRVGQYGPREMQSVFGEDFRAGTDTVVAPPMFGSDQSLLGSDLTSPQGPPQGPPDLLRTSEPPPGQQRWPQVRMPEQPKPVFAGGVAGSQKAPDFGMRAGQTPAAALMAALLGNRGGRGGGGGGGGGGRASSLGELLNGRSS